MANRGNHVPRASTMKCVRKGTEEIIRVSNDQASQLVEHEGYHYTTKGAYKAQQRKPLVGEPAQ